MHSLTSEQLWALPHDSAEAVLSHLAAGLSSGPPPAHFAGATAKAPASPERGAAYQVRDGVALVQVNGTITRSTLYSYFGHQLTQGQDGIAASVDAALSDPTVKAILLDVNSPGGVVAGTKELADRIAAAAKVKPMAAYANGLMASAAMWIGAATGRVLAPVTAMVGSVGVLWVHTDWSRAFERFGVTRSYVTAGRWKAAGNPDAPLAEAERAHFQAQVNAIHEVFKADVSSGLSISAPAEQWAEGQTMLASEARRIGLVSLVVSDLGAAIQTLRQEADMHSKPQGEATALATQPPKPEAQPDPAALAAAAQAARSDLLAIVKTVAGPELHDKLAGLVAAGITPAQLEALSPILAQGAELPASTEEARVKAQILQGIAAVTPGMVQDGQVSQPPVKSKLIADAERRAATPRS